MQKKKKKHCKGKHYRFFSGEELKSTVKSSQSHNSTVKVLKHQKLPSKRIWKIQHYRVLLAIMITFSVITSFSL